VDISGYGKMRSSAITPWKSAFMKLCSKRETILVVPFGGGDGTG
jgi:hypothetical protein